ncbi:MAG: hypothetical protein KDD82_15175 [Planctomycetes bacterium]|nr:hypothetical protein [Planctomycetota bacterium]
MITPRTYLLGGAATLLVGLLAVRMLGSDGAAPGARGDDANPSSVAAVGTPLPVGAPLDLDLKQLEARYAKIGSADPFAARDFRPKAPPRRPRRDPEPSRVVPVAAPPPDKLELRLTGLTGEGAERRAVFEVRAERKALLVASGWVLEDVSIAAVETFTVRAVAKGKETTLDLGDSLEVPKAVRTQLIDVAKASSSPSATPYRAAGSTTPVEPLSEEKRDSILERLRAQREASIKKPTSGD